MDIAIRYFAGVHRADILGLDKIALVAGRNGSGKTSVLQAIAATLCGDPLVRGINAQKSGGEVVAGGVDQAKCRIKNGEAVAMMTWPDCKFQANGTSLETNPYACGMKHVSELGPKERAVILIRLMGAEPTKEDVAKYLVDAGFGKNGEPNQAMVDRVWEEIEDKGWDGYLKKLQVNGTKQKGAWEEITRDTWGSKKSEGWVPEGWDEKLATRAEDSLQKELVSAKGILERMLSNAGAEEGRLEELQKTLDGQVEAQQRKERALEAVQELEEDLEEKVKQLKAIDVPPIQEPFDCPHCGEPLHFGSNVGSELPVVKAEKITGQAKKVQEARDRKIALDHDITALRRQIREEQDAATTAQADITAATVARTEIGKIEAGGVDQKEIDLQRQDVELAERRLMIYQAWARATAIQRSIGTILKVIKGVRPEGIRKTVLTTKLNDLNEITKDLSNRMKLEQQVQIDEDLTIRLGMRRYERLSSSEKIRVNLIIELALARITKAPLVLLDDFDTIEPQGRPPIFHVLRYANIPAVVGMMAKDVDAVPNISKPGLEMGTTYWLEDKELMKVKSHEG